MQPFPTFHLLATDSSRVPYYLPALTGLRALAAYGVYFHHYNPASPGTFPHRLFHQGYVGVSVFFVLSGFLIYHRYADAYYGRTDWSWWRYAQQRFARMFPLYTVLLLLTVTINTMAGRPMSVLLIGLNLTLLKGFFEQSLFSGIPQSWSLTVEICFYLVAPFLFSRLPRWGVVTLSVGLVCLGLLGWATVGPLSAYTHGFMGSVPLVLFYTFFGRAFEFLVGMWLARRWHQNQLPWSRWATVVGLMVITGCISWQAHLPMLTTHPDYLLYSEIVCYNYLLPMGVGTFLVGIIRQPSPIQRLLSQSILQALGRSSYAFYLIHTGIVAHGLQKMGVTQSSPLLGWLILLAYLSYHFIEKPLHTWLRATQ